MVLSREDIVLKMVNGRRKGLEIGPSHNPMFAKASGHDIETLDHATADQLRAKYAPLGLDISRIEEVDYVSDGSPLEDVIPHRSYYDFIFASNVIEHTTDFVGFFKSCEQLLAPNGALVLAVPDKRRCFDAMQPVTTTGDILQGHLEKRTRHNPGRAFDTVVNIVSADGHSVWGTHYSLANLQLDSTIDVAKSLFDRMSDPDAPYIDEHTWRFTPTSLRLIMQDLNYLELTALKLEKLVTYPGFEFFAAFSRTGEGFYEHRMDLLRQICSEQIDGFNQILGRVLTAPPPER